MKCEHLCRQVLHVCAALKLSFEEVELRVIFRHSRADCWKLLGKKKHAYRFQ
ncbi:rRNA-processing protein CGR1 [Sarotherodon galilaeus]